MDNAEIIKLRARAHLLEPTVRVGKNGITDGTITEIVKVLRHSRLVKIKLLRSYIDSHDKDAAAQELAQKTKCELVQQFGNVLVLYKK